MHFITDLYHFEYVILVRKVREYSTKIHNGPSNDAGFILKKIVRNKATYLANLKIESIMY